MVPLAVRLIVTLVGAAMMAGSFVIRSSVDRGLAIHRDRPPALGVDAAAFALRVIGAVVVMAGLLTWVVAYSSEHRTGIF